MYTTPETFVDIDYLLNHIRLKLLQLFQDSVHFHPSFALSINFLFSLPNKLMVSGVCNSSLYILLCFFILSSVHNTNLLLFLLM